MNKGLAVAVIWTLIISDLLSGLFANMGVGFSRIGLIIKSIITLLAIILYMPLIVEKSYRSFYLTLLLLFGFWLIAAGMSLYNNPIYSIFNSFVILNRYFFFIILGCIFLYADKSSDFSEECRKIFDMFFLFNGVVILIGFLFKIELLKTYDPNGEFIDERFGYKGLISGVNEVAGICVLGIAYFYREIFKYGRTKYFLLFLTLITSVLTGTKACAIAVVLLSGYYLLRYRPRFFMFLLLPAIGVCVYYLSKNWNFIVQEYFTNVAEKISQQGLVNYMASGRLKYLFDNFAFMANHWNFLNYIFGDAHLYAEMDFFDLYFFFGIGGIIFLFIYIKLFFLRDRSLDQVYVFFVLMSIAFLAGHIMQTAIVPLFTLLFVFSSPKFSSNGSSWNPGIDQLR